MKSGVREGVAALAAGAAAVARAVVDVVVVVAVVVVAVVVVVVVVAAGVVVAGAVVAGAFFGAAGKAGPFTGATADDAYGARSSAAPTSGYFVFRASESVTGGAPVSKSFVPGSGVCETTVLEEYPWTVPVTFQAKPASSSAPFAKTKAWFRTSGTATIDRTTGGSVVGGVEVLMPC